MFHIAIVDDDTKAIANLTKLLNQYQQETGFQLDIKSFEKAEAFLMDFDSNNYDLLFLDIQIPRISGLEIARQVRKKDRNVSIIFETDFAQYALEGYKYNAVDYFVKPVSYYDVKLRMERLREKINEKTPVISIHIKGGIKNVLVSDIVYVEHIGHDQIYHTKTEDILATGRPALANAEKELSKYGFARCNSSYLINFRYCSSVQQNTVVVDGKEFALSRNMRKDFAEKITHYVENKPI